MKDDSWFLPFFGGCDLEETLNTLDPLDQESDRQTGNQSDQEISLRPECFCEHCTETRRQAKRAQKWQREKKL